MKTQVALVAGAALLSACAYLQPEKVGQSDGREYTVTVRNTLAKERFAPILIVGDADDGKIWVGKYVSSEAHTQFTTGNPGPLDTSIPGMLSAIKPATGTGRRRETVAPRSTSIGRYRQNCKPSPNPCSP